MSIITSSTLITAVSVNNIISTASAVLSTAYGSGLRSQPVSTGLAITTNEWTNLVSDLRRCWIHQNGSLSGFPTVSSLPVSGDKITAKFANSLQDIAKTVNDNVYIVPPENQTQQYTLASSTATIYNNNGITYRVDYTFIDHNAVNYFFNLGGSLDSQLSHAPGTYTGSTATWANFIDWANSQISSVSYARDQWVAPAVISTSYTSGTNSISLGIFPKNNPATTNTITVVMTVTNAIGTVSIPTTATSRITCSILGPSIDGYYGIASPIPQASIITSFGSGQIPPVVPTRILTVGQPDIFRFPADSNSDSQSITIANSGNTTCNIYSIIASNPDTYLTPEINGTTGEIHPSWAIGAGSSRSFNLRYIRTSRDSVSLTINDVGPSGGSQIFNYGYWNNNGSLTPTAGTLWGGNITGFYTRISLESGNNQGTYLEFGESQLYAGPYYITYRGTTYTFLPTSPSDPYSWFNSSTNIFLAYGNQSIIISVSPEGTVNQGTYEGYLSVYSDANNSPATVKTQLVVTAPVFDFYLIPDQWNTTYTYSDKRSITQNVTIGGKGSFTSISYGTDTNFLSSGFSIKDSTSVVGFDIAFNPLNLINSTYITTATIGINSVQHKFTATIILNTPAAPVNQHLGDWVSAYQADNGVIGASYDIINGVRYITLGFGMGADGGGTVAVTNGSNVNFVNLGTGSDVNFALGPVLYSATGSGYYDDFLKPRPTGHGVWVNDSGWSPIDVRIPRTYTFTASVQSSEYTYTFAADNQGYFTIDNGIPINANLSNSLIPVYGNIDLSSGTHSLTLYFYNAPGSSNNIDNPGAIALTITDPNGSIVWDSNFPVRTGYTPYQYWNEVCRIPLNDPPASGTVYNYYSKNYLIKNLCPLGGRSYGSYFGADGAAGSMFTVAQNDRNEITITLNDKTESIPDKTTDNARYLFYYYIGALPAGDRLSNLELNPGTGNPTQYFTGFKSNGAVTTIPKDQPTSFTQGPVDIFGGGGCPDPATPITVSASGYTQPAGQLVVGNRVWTQHETTGAFGNYPITAVEIIEQPRVKICFNDGTDMIVSDTHKFLMQDLTWQQVFQLSIGDTIKGLVIDKSVVGMELIGFGPVVKITVDRAHTYIAGGLISHNKQDTNSDNQFV